MAQASVRSLLEQGKAGQHGSRTYDSPSRQLQLELEHALSQMNLYENERQKVHAFNRRSLQQELDARELEQAKLHRAELDLASAKHELVRRHAQEVLEAHIQAEDEKRRLEEEREARRKREELRKKAEEQRQQQEAIERKQREEREKAHAAKRAAEEKARAEAEDKQRRNREASARQEKVEKEQAEEKRRAEEVALKNQQEKVDAEARAKAKAAEEQLQQRQSQQQQQQRQAPASLPGASTTRGTDSDAEIQHKNYLIIHKKLKSFRKQFWEATRKDPNLKPVVGDMRRAIRTSVGQLTDDKVGNRKATERVKGAILKSLKEIQSPPIMLNDYLPPHLALVDGDTTTVPSLVLYLISIFSKAIINSFVGECAVNTKAAEPIGTLAAQIFSMPEIQYHSNSKPTESGNTGPVTPMKPEITSLITILMCKFHAVAPMLFGIFGSESTKAGRLRLGWRLDYIQAGQSEKTFAPEQRQYDRMIGLGAGYASIALRNFSKAKLTNPYPPIHFWESFASIVNTPPEMIQTSQLIILKSMLEVGVDRFVLFFGAAAIAAVREALVELPKKLDPELAEKPAAKALVLLVESFKQEKNFSLT